MCSCSPGCKPWQSQIILTRRKETMKTGGLSRERLVRLHTSMTGYVERGEVPGIVTPGSRHGQVHLPAAGHTSLDAPTPMRPHTILRYASHVKGSPAAL